MKKFLIIALCVICMFSFALLFTACGDSTSPDTDVELPEVPV